MDFRIELFNRSQAGEKKVPYLVKFHKMDIWVQIYDLPPGFVLEQILRSIGNYVRVFIKANLSNANGAWKMFVRIREAIDIDKPLKQR